MEEGKERSRGYMEQQHQPTYSNERVSKIFSRIITNRYRWKLDTLDMRPNDVQTLQGLTSNRDIIEMPTAGLGRTERISIILNLVRKK